MAASNMTEAEVKAWVAMAKDGSLSRYLNQYNSNQACYEAELRRRSRDFE